MKRLPSVNAPGERLVEGCRQLGIYLTQGQREQFSRYLEELLAWNSRINLISRHDEPRIISRHFLESLILLQAFPFPQRARVLDVGSGAGFPGLPVKICRPDLDLTLLDSIRKKVLFLRHLVEVLHLDGVRAVCSRVEDMASGEFDLVISRTALRLHRFVEYAIPRVAEGGWIATFLGSSRVEDWMTLRRTLEGRGLKIDYVIKSVRAPFIEQDRYVLVLAVHGSSDGQEHQDYKEWGA